MTDARYPRAWVSLGTSVLGEEADTGIVPTHASYTRRSHSQAGEAEVTIHGSALPFDPQAIDGVFLVVYMGDVGRVGGDVRAERFKRFVGYVDTFEETRDENGPAIELKARDLSSLLRDFKPVPTDARPRYSDTLQQAARRLVDVVPNCRNADGSPRITVRDDPSSPLLSSAVHARGARGAVVLPNDVTAWGALEHCAGLVSKLVSVDLDEIVVRDPTQSFDGRSPSVADFVFGDPTAANLISIKRERKFVRNRKGVLVTSYDPVNRRTLRAVYPPDGALLPSGRPHARVGGTVLHGAATARARATRQTALAHDREAFAAPNGIASQDALDRYAQRIYLERSRQEMEGKFTHPWDNDALALTNGDRVTIRVNPALEAELFGTSVADARAIDLLSTRLLLDRDALRVLINATRRRELSQFYVRSASHSFEAEGDSTSQVEFINLINVT